MASDEARLVEQARNFQNPISREVFLKLAGAAGATSLLGIYGARAAKAARSDAVSRLAVERGIVGEQIHTLANDYFVNFNRGAQQWAKAVRNQIKILEHQGNVSTQLSQIGDLNNQDIRMLFGNVATEGLVPTVSRACQRASIYWANIYDLPPGFTPADVGDKYALYTTPHSEQVAYQLAKLLFERIDGRGSVIHIPAIPNASADIERTAGFERALKEFPRIEVHTGSPGNWNRIDARKSFADAIQAVPDFDAVYAQNDSEASGVLSVLKERGIKGKPVIGFDGNKENILLIAKGDQLATHATVGGYQAALCATWVWDALNGWKQTLPERMMYTESILITRDAARDFYADIYGAKTLPFDWEKMSKTLHPQDWDPQAIVTPINPITHWKGRKLKFKLNPAYAKSVASGEFARVTRMYRTHYKTGPFKKFEKGGRVA
jgi:ribose transport system substrate-binding protein